MRAQDRHSASGHDRLGAARPARTASPLPAAAARALAAGRAGRLGPEAVAALQRSAGNAAVQRARIAPPGQRDKVDTTTLSDEQIIKLAQQLLRHKRSLDALRRDHPHLAEQLTEASLRKAMPRYREVDPESEGESDSEDPNVLYRSLRPEEEPSLTGIRPPAVHDASVSAAKHIQDGSKLEVKSAWVSFTRSLKVAAAWASQANEEKAHRIVKVRIPQDKAFEKDTYYDTTDPKQFDTVFGGDKRSANNAAKSSQEVLIKNGLGPGEGFVFELLDAYQLEPAVYQKMKQDVAGNPGDGGDVYALVKTRAKAKDPVTPIGVYQHGTPGAAQAAQAAQAAKAAKETQEAASASAAASAGPPAKKRRTRQP